MRVSVLACVSGLTILGSRTVAESFEPPTLNLEASLRDLGIDVTARHGLASGGSKSCASVCSLLSSVYGTDAVYVDGEAPYEEFVTGFWSMNQYVNPFCVFRPSDKSAVSALILLSRLSQCPFAFKSGGHAAFTGASNIEGGITVSLERMKDIVVSDDRSEVTIQPGNTWADVYNVLDPQGLTVPGGRVSRVGTGGLTLGGGISFFSSIYGWACDNVIDYEVVTASGVTIHATPTTHSDLYWALRGGGNNFGIVTSFTFETIPLPGGEMWGGSKVFAEPDFSTVTQAFHDAIVDSPRDPNAGLWVAWIFNQGMKLASAQLWYALPDASDATIFDGFDAATALLDTTAPRTVSNYTDELQSSNPYGFRELYWTITTKADPVMVAIARDTYYEELPTVDDVQDVGPAFVMQGITHGLLERMSRNGGNPLGLEVSDGPLYNFQISIWWSNPADDTAVYDFVSTTMSRINAKAVELGLDHDYIYMNYASPFQNPIAGYGASNLAKLKKIATKYDPHAVFQKLQPGHFKLDHAPFS